MSMLLLPLLPGCHTSLPLPLIHFLIWHYNNLRGMLVIHSSSLLLLVLLIFPVPTLLIQVLGINWLLFNSSSHLQPDKDTKLLSLENLELIMPLGAARVAEVADIHAQLAAIQQQQPPPARRLQQPAVQTVSGV
ncbi:hypothetical protein K439DRAFT_1612937 [Ramaria rubella]|nr:hypothetical protein K439DRAFT_1612937 [Ramaria rubella]